MNKEYIEWCTNRLDQTSKPFVETRSYRRDEIVLDDCIIESISRYTLISNGYEHKRSTPKNFAYALLKETKFQALRLYGLGQADYNYVQYIVGVGLQVVYNNGVCVLVNKAYPLVSPYLQRTTPPRIGNTSFVETTKWMNGGGSSFLSLYGLAYASEYFEIVCLNFYFDVEYEKHVAECIKTMGLYSIYLYRNLGSDDHSVANHVLVVAKSEAIFLKYYRRLKWIKPI